MSEERCLSHGCAMPYDRRSGFNLCPECEAETEASEGSIVANRIAHYKTRAETAEAELTTLRAQLEQAQKELHDSRMANGELVSGFQAEKSKWWAELEQVRKEYQVVTVSCVKYAGQNLALQTELEQVRGAPPSPPIAD